MDHVKGKLTHTEENMRLILELVQDKKFCYGINEYNFIYYIRFESDASQLWAMVNSTTHAIRNCGLNKTVDEYRLWRAASDLNNKSHSITNIIKPQSLTLFQIFNSMRMYINRFWQETMDDDIGLLLSDLMLSNDHNDWKENPRTWDPPAWSDWMAGVNKTLQDLNINDNPQIVSYDAYIAFFCMKNYLQLFYEQIPFEGIENILKRINQITPKSNSTSWNHWLTCVNAAIEQEPHIVG